MNIMKLSLLPQLGLAVAHRTTREWRFGGSTRRDGDGLATGLGRVVGLAAGVALGAGLALLFSPETRATARRALEDAFPKRRAPSGNGGSTDRAASPGVAPLNAGARDSEDADACDAS